MGIFFYVKYDKLSIKKSNSLDAITGDAKMMNKPHFTQEQKDYICYQIGVWYYMMKPLLEGQHNLGHMKEKLKTMICGDK